MPKASQMAQRKWHHIMIHGDPKSGKSTLVSQLALAGYRIDWISVDNGHEVVFKLPAEVLDLITIFHLPDIRSFPIGIATVRQIVKGGKHRICDQHGQINCSICSKQGKPFTALHMDDGDPKHVTFIDHASALAESAMNVAYSKFNKPDEDAPQQEFKHHALQGFLMNEILSAIQHFPGHVIVASHSLEVEMEDGKKRIVPHIGSREFSRNAGKYFDHVIHCSVNNLAHKFGSKTTYSAMVLTGSRSDVDISIGDGKNTLLPFLTSTIVAAKDENGTLAAQKLLRDKLPVIDLPIAEVEKKPEVAVEVEVPETVDEPIPNEAISNEASAIPLATQVQQQAQPGRSPAQILADIRAKQNGGK